MTTQVPPLAADSMRREAPMAAARARVRDGPAPGLAAPAPGATSPSPSPHAPPGPHEEAARAPPRGAVAARGAAEGAGARAHVRQAPAVDLDVRAAGEQPDAVVRHAQHDAGGARVLPARLQQHAGGAG